MTQLDRAALGRARRRSDTEADRHRVRLPYTPPCDWPSMLAFLRARATPGVEWADDRSYRRAISIDGRPGAIEVTHAASGAALDLDVQGSEPRALAAIVERVRRLFDLDADPRVIAGHLSADPLLGPPLARHPGVRVPGAWEGFEIAVRAILGQQVSVRAATTIAGRIATMFGAPVAAGDRLARLFPAADVLAVAPLEQAGVMPARAETIRRLAREVAGGRLALGPGADREATVASLTALAGIGDWTAQYIAMRALGDRDAFPSGDLILRRAAGGCTARALERRSQAWRPWRAYAVILLWQTANDRPGAAPTAARRSAAGRARR